MEARRHTGGYDFSQGKRDPVLPQKGKSRITIYLDDEVLDAFRDRADRAGFGYQTMINQALREYLGKIATPLDETALRRVLREELAAVPRQGVEPGIDPLRQADQRLTPSAGRWKLCRSRASQPGRLTRMRRHVMPEATQLQHHGKREVLVGVQARQRYAASFSSIWCSISSRWER